MGACEPPEQFQIRPGASILGPRPGKITKPAEFISYSAVRHANILTIYLPEGKKEPSSCIPNPCLLVYGQPRGAQPPRPRAGARESWPSQQSPSLRIGKKIHTGLVMGAPRLGSKHIHAIAMDQAKKSATTSRTSHKRGCDQVPRQPPARVK